MVAGDRDCSVRTELLAAVMCNLVAQRADDSQLLQTLLSELPPVRGLPKTALAGLLGCRVQDSACPFSDC